MSDSKISAIVLRFRDKGENVVNTIAEHQKFINNGELGYVWWGWWAKDYELPPFDYLEAIDKSIKSPTSDFKVFLLHTKNETLYEAICTEIRFSDDPANKSIQTPDESATPLYYNKINAKLWLKFVSIQKTSPALLFDGVYSFMPDSTSFFTTEIKQNHLVASFANCQVSKMDELILQRRTIWFLRKQRKSDRSTNIDEWLPLPDNFAKHYTYARQNAYKLLVLSDLHFTEDGKHHNFMLNNAAPPGRPLSEVHSLLESLEYTIANSDIGGFEKIAGVLIAGDFVFRPTADEFGLAKSFIKELLERAALRPEQLSIVPGNHDIAYMAPDPSSVSSSFPNEACAEAKRLYREFYESIYNTSANKYLCSCRRIKLPNELQIEIIGLNSCILQQEEDNFVQGYVGANQWHEIQTQLNMNPNVPTYTYRILLLHHHLMSTSIYSERPEKGKNYNILLDAGSVSHNIRRYNIKLVIHGHGHESGHDYSAPRKKKGEEFAPSPYDVISMGSAGSSDLPSGEKNSFGILDFESFGKVIYKKYYLPTTDRERDMGTFDQPVECWEIPIFDKCE